MPERENDPIASTQMFRAFVQGGEPQAPGRRRSRAMLVSVVVVVLVAAAVVGWLIAR
jgi:hypothetical protein